MLNRYTDLQAHYTEAEEINKLMVALLGDVDGKKILEPSVGTGALIRDLLGTPARLDVVDLDPAALDYVAREHNEKNVRVIHADFLHLFVDNELTLAATLASDYDAVIANPPYGLEIPIPFRKRIKQVHQGIYARESYGLFLYFSLLRLRPGGRYVFLIPDTFIFSTNHRPLRRFLAEYTQVTELIQFESSRFGSVKYGYSGMCIIAGFIKPHNSCLLRWLNLANPTSSLTYQELNTATKFNCEQLTEQAEGGWHTLLSSLNLHSYSGLKTLGDYAACKTGIYTGDNGRFLGYGELKRRGNANGHQIDWDNSVCVRALNEDEKTNGLKGGPKYVRLIRGGHREIFEQTSWAIDWSREAVQYYRNDKKARLQNQNFYFRRGIAVPMVTSGRLSASVMEHSVFDQGVVGVFPNEPDHFWAILLYLNSSFVTERLKPVINPSANNSANYLKKLPIPEIAPAICEAAQKTAGVIREFDQLRALAAIDNFVDDCMAFTI